MIEDYKPCEFARELDRLLKENPSLTFDIIAKRILKPVTWVAQRATLIKLLPEIQELVDSDSLNILAAYTLARWSPAWQKRLLPLAKSLTGQEFLLQFKDMRTMTFRNLLRSPSGALQAMLGGLHQYGTQPDNVRITLDKFAIFDTAGVLHICPATCAILHTLSPAFSRYTAPLGDKSEDRAVQCNWNVNDFKHFEMVMDAARLGWLGLLFSYFGLPFTVDWDRQINFNNVFHWEEQLPKLEELISELRKNGL